MTLYGSDSVDTFYCAWFLLGEYPGDDISALSLEETADISRKVKAYPAARLLADDHRVLGQWPCGDPKVIAKLASAEEKEK